MHHLKISLLLKKFKMTRDIESHRFMENRWGNSEKSGRIYFGGAPKSQQMVTAAIKLKGA